MRTVAIMTIAGVISAGVAAGAVWSQSPPAEPVVRITARRFAYDPPEVTLTRGVPVVLELVSLDRPHGFRVPSLGVRADVLPDTATRLRIVPERAGRFSFLCDVFCGADHDDMEGTIVVREP